MAPGLDVLLGPFLVGPLVVYLLLGGYMVQLFYYLTHDTVTAARVQLHILVGVVTLAELTNVVFVSLNAWRDLVSAVGDPSLREVAPPTAPGTSALNGIVACLVQCFFAWRITRLTRKRYRWIRYTIPAAIVALALLHVSAAFFVSAKFISINRRAVFMGRMRLSITLYLSAGLACDTLITISMIFILLDFKARTEISTTKRLLNSLIFHAVENGAITTLCAALNLAFYITRSSDNIHVAFQFAIGGLYANVLLAALNGRGRGGQDTSTGGSIDLREQEIAFRRGTSSDFGDESTREVSFSTQRSSALYRLTAPTKHLLHPKAGGDSRKFESIGNGISKLSLGLPRKWSRKNRTEGDGVKKKEKGKKKGKKEKEEGSPPPPTKYLVSTVTEVHRDEDLVGVGRRTSGYATATATTTTTEGSGRPSVSTSE